MLKEDLGDSLGRAGRGAAGRRRRSRCGWTPAAEPLRRELAPLLSELGPAAPGAGERGRLFDAVRQFLEAVGEERAPVSSSPARRGRAGRQSRGPRPGARSRPPESPILRTAGEREAAFDFSHDLLRQAAYRQLSEPRRRLRPAPVLARTPEHSAVAAKLGEGSEGPAAEALAALAGLALGEAGAEEALRAASAVDRRSQIALARAALAKAALAMGDPERAVEHLKAEPGDPDRLSARARRALEQAGRR
jgi:hypothetical protein